MCTKMPCASLKYFLQDVAKGSFDSFAVEREREEKKMIAFNGLCFAFDGMLVVKDGNTLKRYLKSGESKPVMPCRAH